MSSLFALGLYLNEQPTTTVGGGFDPTLSSSMQHPLAGSYGGPLSLVWYPLIRAPESVAHTPAAPIGTDLYGRPIVRGYARMTWQYSFLPSDEWYYLYGLFRLSHRSGVPGKLHIQWPDPQSGATTTASARWQAIENATRQVGGMNGVTLTFAYLGIDDSSVTGTWLPPAAPFVT